MNKTIKGGHIVDSEPKQASFWMEQTAETAAERAVPELSERDSRITALCQRLQALNNEKAKMSTRVSTARGLWNSESESKDRREDRGIADGITVEQNREQERGSSCRIPSASVSSW